MDFLCYNYKIDTYETIVQKQSVIFTVRVHSPLDDDGSKKLSEVCRFFAPCLQTRAMYYSFLCHFFYRRMGADLYCQKIHIYDFMILRRRDRGYLHHILWAGPSQGSRQDQNLFVEC